MTRTCSHCGEGFIAKFESETRHPFQCKKRKPTAEEKYDWRLKHQYGISLADYRALETQQGFRCAICGVYPDKLFVDHDHKTGKVRALLCLLCNNGLGSFRDNIEFLESAVQYLRRYSNRETLTPIGEGRKGLPT